MAEPIDPADEVERRQDFLAAQLRALGARLHHSAREADETASELERLADNREEGERGKGSAEG